MAPKGAGEYHMNFILEWITLAIIFVYILFYGSVFEISYPKRIVELYAYPWWRILIVGLVVLGSSWSPRIGLAMALGVFLYLNDLDILTSPFLNIQ
jgi:hypothetical protein